MKNTKRVIILEDSLGRKEEWAGKLGIKYPLYMPSYTEALKAILDNIQYNRSACEERRKEKHIFIGAGSRRVDLEESNIFAFLGGRGSGKTTAVNEFCRILHEYYDKREKWEKEPGFACDAKEYCFHVMEPIDASGLEAKEDLVEVILASMFQAFQEVDRRSRETSSVVSDSAQKVADKFDKVYKAYINVGNHRNGEQSGATALVKLKNTSNSLMVKATIENLAEEFLKYIDRDHKAEDTYLVVTIDDLDLNLENGYEMLEQLHKYLANRKVIILVAVKYEQMKMICERHIVDCLIPEYGSTHEKIFRKYDQRARKLSNDYLLKVLPLTNRIYMPERGLIYKKSVMGERKNAKSRRDEPSIKDYLLLKIALKMGVYYDAQGLKKHFCLPETVRELVSYDDFLESLVSMEQEEVSDGRKAERWMYLYDQNHERFNRDIESRMANQVLNDAQMALFQKIMDRDIKRRAEYTVNFLESWREIKRRTEQETETRLADKVDEKGYCYTDLLGALYGLGRNDYDDKPLVHCLLASFTSEMVREYYCYRYNDNKKSREESEKCLKALLGKNFGGVWFENIMPVMRIQPNTNSGRWSAIRIGYIEQAPMFHIAIKDSLSYVAFSRINIEEQIELLVRYVPYMECLSLCFSNFRDALGRQVSCEWNFELKSGETEKGFQLELLIRNNVEYADYDIFGFIGKEFSERAEVTRMCDELAKKLSECLYHFYQEKDKTFEGEKSDLDKAFLEKARERSIWVETKDRVTFPFYDLDMAYNIMKRVRTKIKETQFIVPKDICNYFQTVYGYIAKELRKEQEYYSTLIKRTADDKDGAMKEQEDSYILANGVEAPRFYEDFVESPYIKFFGIRYEWNGKAEYLPGIDDEALGNIFFKAIRGLSVVLGGNDMREQDMEE